MELNIKDKQFILGVNWFAPKNRKDARILKREAGKEVKSFRFESEDDDQDLIGFYPKKEKGIIASCILAKLYENGCYVVELDEEKLWLCAVIDGHPASGFDLVLPKSEVGHHIDELYQVIPDIEIHEAPISSDEQDVKTADKFWQEIIESIDNDEIEDLSKCTVGHVDVKKIVGVALILSINGVIAYNMLHKEPPPPAPVVSTPVIKKNVERSPSPEDLKAQRINRLKQEYQARYDKALNDLKVMRVADMQGWFQVIDSLPLEMYGYRVEVVNCDISGCKVQWRALNQNLVRSQDRFKLPKVLLGKNDKNSSFNGDYSIESFWENQPKKSFAPSIKNPVIWRAKFMDNWKNINSKEYIYIGPAKPVMVQGNREIGIKDALIGWKVQGSWSKNGKQALDQARLILEFLNSSNIYAKSMRVIFNRDGRVAVKVDYDGRFLKK